MPEFLSDCRVHILALPKAGQKRWEPVVAELLTAAERDDGPRRFFARMSFASMLHGVEGVGPRLEKSENGSAWKAKRAACQDVGRN